MSSPHLRASRAQYCSPVLGGRPKSRLTWRTEEKHSCDSFSEIVSSEIFSSFNFTGIFFAFESSEFWSFDSSHFWFCLRYQPCIYFCNSTLHWLSLWASFQLKITPNRSCSWYMLTNFGMYNSTCLGWCFLNKLSMDNIPWRSSSRSSTSVI